MSSSALCFFKVANRATFSRILKREMATPEALARRREIVIDTIVEVCEDDAECLICRLHRIIAVCSLGGAVPVGLPMMLFRWGIIATSWRDERRNSLPLWVKVRSAALVDGLRYEAESGL
jgi:hypothetical protein